MQIVSASHGQDRTSFIQVSSPSHQNVTIAERRSPDFKLPGKVESGAETK